MMDISSNVVLWVVIGLIAVAAIVFRFLEQASRHKMLRTLAEKGQPIPPEIFTSRAEAYHRTAASFRAGIILMSIGVATAIFFFAMTSDSVFAGPIHGVNWLPVLGVIPFMLGFALLVIAVFERRMPPPPDKS